MLYFPHYLLFFVEGKGKKSYISKEKVMATAAVANRKRIFVWVLYLMQSSGCRIVGAWGFDLCALRSVQSSPVHTRRLVMR